MVGSDLGSPRNSQVAVQVNGGQTYYIRVANYVGSPLGVFYLGGILNISNDNCPQAQFVSPGITPFCNFNSTQDGFSEFCLSANGSIDGWNDVWFRFTCQRSWPGDESRLTTPASSTT